MKWSPFLLRSRSTEHEAELGVARRADIHGLGRGRSPSPSRISTGMLVWKFAAAAIGTGFSSVRRWPLALGAQTNTVLALEASPCLEVMA